MSTTLASKFDLGLSKQRGSSEISISDLLNPELHIDGSPSQGSSQNSSRNSSRNSTRNSTRSQPQISVTRKDLQTYSPDQELAPFGKWVSDSIWIPPKDTSDELAESMLDECGALMSKDESWSRVVENYRDRIIQVREFELTKASIRLPQGRVFMAITERKDFDTIEDYIPKCVQTRLDEFLAGPGKRKGVKVYYLKPLCIEVDHELVFTTRQQVDRAIATIQGEVFAAYRKKYADHRARLWSSRLVNATLAVPRFLMKRVTDRKRKEIEAYHSKLEYERRKRALRATKAHLKLRSDGCTFDEMLALMDPPKREDVIEQYVEENELSKIDRDLFLYASALSVPWILGMSIAVGKLIALSIATSAAVTACDPAFVAEMPDSDGTLLKIGHFDEVDGVMHVEI